MLWGEYNALRLIRTESSAGVALELSRGVHKLSRYVRQG